MSQVVLHITIDGNIVKGLAFKLRKNLLARLAEHISQHVQSTAVCHAEHELFYPVARPVIHRFVQSRDEAFCTFDREALLSHKLGIQERLEAHCLVQHVQNLLLFLRIEVRLVVVSMDPMLNPSTAFRIADIVVFHPDALAINLLKVRNDFAKGCRATQSKFSGSIKFSVQILRAKPEVFDG